MVVAVVQGELGQILCFPGTWERWLYLSDSWLLCLSHGIGERHLQHAQKQVAVLLVLSDRLREPVFGVGFEDVIYDFFTLQEMVRGQRI